MKQIKHKIKPIPRNIKFKFSLPTEFELKLKQPLRIVSATATRCHVNLNWNNGE